MVVLGALFELTHALPKAGAYTVLKTKVKNPKLFEVDCQAIDAGSECLRKQRDPQDAHLAGTEGTRSR